MVTINLLAKLLFTCTFLTAACGGKVTFPLKPSPVPGYKYTTVFGVHLFSQTSVPESKLQHGASVLAAWLDNDQDGCVDTPAAVTALTEAGATQAGTHESSILDLSLSIPR